MISIIKRIKTIWQLSGLLDISLPKKEKKDLMDIFKSKKATIIEKENILDQINL